MKEQLIKAMQRNQLLDLMYMSNSGGITKAQGSMALLLASGAVNGTIGQGDTLHAVQGMEVVTKVVSEEETEHTLITKTRTKREVSVKVITP
ncbi:hypothetical protein [Viridibacillus soli]|uniref:hypothetical protein n=1 Tax=Viridibacillus soli TaxID=2798301 RepID=UPI001F326B76|nr:hypothetical protein [Viridibacillus soli]